MNFIVETTEAAEAETEAAFLRLSAYAPDFAGRWLEGLTRAIISLETLPRRHERVQVEGAGGRETRRMLYRNGRTVYRIVFTLVDADDDGKRKPCGSFKCGPLLSISPEVGMMPKKYENYGNNRQ